MKDSDKNPTRGADLSIKKAAPSFNGEYYLLAIGIDRYQHHSELHNAVADAQAFVNILTEQYQFSAEKTIQIYNEEATQDNILNTLNKYIEAVQEQDCLVVYFSGHGEYRKQSYEGFWIPHDGGLHKEGSWVSNDTVVNKISAIKSHHTLVIVDSCFAGALFEVRKIGSIKAALDKIPSRWLFTSGRYEEVPDGKAGMHSPFAENLLYFLKHNEAPHLSITQLVDHVTEATLANSKQQPRGEPLQNVGHKGGQFYFYKKGVAPARPVPVVKEEAVPAPGTAKQPRINWPQLIGISIAAGLAIVIMLWFFPISNNKEQNPLSLEASTRAEEVKDSSHSIANVAQDTQSTIPNPTSKTDHEKGATQKETPKKQTERKKPDPVKSTFASADEFQDFCGTAVNGLICAKYNNRWGYVKRIQGGQLEAAIPFLYEEAQAFTGRFALVKKNKRYGWIDTKGNAHIAFKYVKVGTGQNGKPDNILRGARVMNTNRKWGMINAAEKVVLPFQYDAISAFDEDNIAIVEQDGAFGFVNRTGTLLAAGCNYEAVEKNGSGSAKAKLFGEGWTIIELE